MPSDMHTDFTFLAPRGKRYLIADTVAGVIHPTDEAIRACKRPGKLEREKQCGKPRGRTEILAGMVKESMGIINRNPDLVPSKGFATAVWHLAQVAGEDLPKMESVPRAKMFCDDRTPFSVGQGHAIMEAISSKFLGKPCTHPVAVAEDIKRRLARFAGYQAMVMGSQQPAAEI